MIIRNLSGDKGRPALKVHNLTAICEAIVYKMWGRGISQSYSPVRLCYRDNITSLSLAAPAASSNSGFGESFDR
jgi:hypothetical protein